MYQESEQRIKRAQSPAEDQGSPEIIQELLDTNSEWINIQDIVKLTFKGIYHTLKVQNECIKDIEMILPQKAFLNEVREEMRTQLYQKANLNDMKKTMSEVAANIESRVTFSDVKRMIESKVDKSDIQFLLQHKIQFEDMKNYIDQILLQKLNPGQDQIEEEIKRLRKYIDEQVYLLKVNNEGGMNVNIGPPNLQKIEQNFEKRFQDIEEQLSNKASKQSVAQALHRKLNKNEFDDCIQKKAELQDFQRVFAALDQKVDVSNFEKILLSLDNKADRFEIKSKGFGETLNEDRIILNLNQLKFEFEGKLQNQEDNILKIQKEFSTDLQNLRQQLISNIQTKADYKDFDQLNLKLNVKLDAEKGQIMITDLRNEISQSLISQQQNCIKLIQELDQELQKISQEIVISQNSFKQDQIQIFDKIKKLASQFDKELLIRDKQIKQFMSQTQDDMQRDHQSFQQQIDLQKQLINDIDVRKSDKKDHLDLKQKIQIQIESKVEKTEFNKLITEFTGEQNQKFFGFRKELFEKISDIHKDISQNVGQFVQISEMNQILDTKADKHSLQQVIQEKASVFQVDTIGKAIERIAQELERRPEFRDIENQNIYIKSKFEDLSKDILLKASIKDLIQLLDQKVNVSDINQTLQLIQNEVEKCVREQDLKKSLNEQALVNEALCAENCVGRWIWKSGDLHQQNHVPWEVQAINTCPDNFLWEMNKSSIICVAPGLYQLALGFFSKKEPTIQLFLNGEPLLTVQKSIQQQKENSSKSVQHTTKHSAGNVTGVTKIEFIALPARARISVLYFGDSFGEGFLCLKKL